MARRKALVRRFSNTISYTVLNLRIISPYSARAAAGEVLTPNRRPARSSGAMSGPSGGRPK